MELTPGLKQSRAIFSSAPGGRSTTFTEVLWIPEFPAQDALARGAVSSVPVLTYEEGADPMVCDQDELSSPNETAPPASPSLLVLTTAVL